MMVDPDGDGDNKDYYEIQINPQNLVFDTQYDDYNSPNGNGKGPFGHEEWSANLTSAVVVHGTLDDDSDTDKGYTVEAKVPWASFTKAKHSPPQPGRRLANELLRDEEQRRNRLVPNPRNGQLPPRLALRPREVDERGRERTRGSERCTSAVAVADAKGARRIRGRTAKGARRISGLTAKDAKGARRIRGLTAKNAKDARIFFIGALGVLGGQISSGALGVLGG